MTENIEMILYDIVRVKKEISEIYEELNRLENNLIYTLNKISDDGK